MSVRKCSQKQVSNLIPKKHESNADYYCGLDVVGAPHIQSFDPYTHRPPLSALFCKSKHICIVVDFPQPLWTTGESKGSLPLQTSSQVSKLR